MSSQHLITPEALQKLLASDPGSVLVCDCRYDLVDADLGRRAYEASHIPGAVFVDLGRMLSGEKNGSNGRHPLPEQRQRSPAAAFKFLWSSGRSHGAPPTGSIGHYLSSNQ